MPEPVDSPAFVLYVVWHPDYAHGKKTAGRLLHHFGTDRYQDIVGGAGVSVLFNSAAAPGLDAPAPIDWDAAETTAVVALIDRTLVSSPTWSEYIHHLSHAAETAGLGTRLFPVSMEAGALEIDLDIQALRWDQWTEDETQRENRLLRELTHEFSRMLRHRLGLLANKGNDALRDYQQSVQVFLSHSKHDEHGKSVAETIRNWVHDNSALSTFLDVHDIPPGVPWATVIRNSIADGAMVAIRTDTYSSRTWCRREVIEAKRKEVPLLVVDCLRFGEERAFPYLGNVSVIRMEPGDRDRVEGIISRLLDEVFKNFLWRLQIARFRESHPRVTFVAKAPELLSLAALSEIHDGADQFDQIIVYPGPPLGIEETQLFADIAPNLQLRTLENWQAEN